MNINATLIGQIIAFAVFVWFCMKFVWPPLINSMEERAKKIADGLDAANRAERDLSKLPKSLSKPTSVPPKSLTKPKNRLALKVTVLKLLLKQK